MKNNICSFKLITISWLLAIITGCTTVPISTEAPSLDNNGWLSKKSYYEKLVHYGTTREDRYLGLNRSYICRNQKSTYFRGKYDASKEIDDCKNNLFRLNTGNDKKENSITYGSARIKIPYTKEVGETAGMSLTNLNHDIGWKKFKSNISKDDVLIFIHGFNTSFSSAAIRCAQLAHDTNFKGKAVFYSWSSHESSFNPSYNDDKKRAVENFELFADFLQGIASTTDKNIHIVAHSMGTYILMHSLAILDKRIQLDNNILHSRRTRLNGKIFKQVILAAPDIEKDSYHRNFSKHNFSKMAERYTLYSTENDYVLRVSKIVNYFGKEGSAQARLGDSSRLFFVIDGMDTIDARQEISSQFFGHSFYAENRSLVSDMYDILNHGTQPDKRILQKVYDKKKNKLWFIRD